jgi:hypothetical protein
VGGVKWGEGSKCPCNFFFYLSIVFLSAELKRGRSQWLRGLGVGLRPLLAGTVGSNPDRGHGCLCECFMLSGRGLCVGLITLPEESCRV